MNRKEQAIEAPTVWTLANDAGVSSPDSATSAGAEFLLGVWESAKEAYTDGRLDDEEATDIAQEIADGAPDYRTHTCWREFVDLCAYQEDVSDFVTGDAADVDMDRLARLALYLIAERLATVTLEGFAGEAQS